VGPVLRNGDQAIGDFQFTAGTWKEWGKGGDRFSFKDEANAAANYMAFLKKKYKGDVSAALAAYNWGPGNVDKAMSKPGNWQDRLPRETRDYLNKIVGAIAKQQPAKVQVTVTNNTAARVAVQANAAAAQ
jgi:soluble lytic murein transglycosylase-like protein